MAGILESRTHSFYEGSDSAWMKELITPGCQTSLIKELLERILELYFIILRLWNYFHRLADREELWNDELLSDEVATQAVERSMVVLLSLNLQFREVHARETKLNSSACTGGDEPHLSHCMKLPESEFGCTYVWSPHAPLTGWACCHSSSFFLSIQC